MKVAYIFPPPWDPTYPPYAMALFAGSTRREGHEFFGFDLNVDLFNAATAKDKELWNSQYAIRWDSEYPRIVLRYSLFLRKYIAEILRTKANLYGIYVTVRSKQIALFLAKKIKEKRPNAAIILGGPECFPAYEGKTLLVNKFIDAICTGEGDQVWPRVLDGLSKQGNLRLDMPGIAYNAIDGTVVDGGIPELVENLDGVPFADYRDVDFGKYAKAYHIATMTSRGCINTCAFCSERPNFFKYRHRSAGNVLDEIVEHLGVMKGAVPWINFNDSLINGAPRELERFCDMVIERGMTFRWMGMALIRKEMTQELLQKMKKAGCYHLAWGLESGCQEVLTLMRKRFFTIDLAKEVIERTHTVGIQQSINIIVGFPGETERMFQETLAFVNGYRDYFSTVGVIPMLILRNSAVYDEYEEFGLDVENSRDELKWRSLDGSNTYETRIKRLQMLTSVLGEKSVTVDWDPPRRSKWFMLPR